MCEAGGAKSDATMGFLAAIERAESVLQSHDRDVQQRHHLAEQCRQAEQVDAQDRSRLEEAEERLATWRRDWAAKMDKLGYENDVTPAQADDLLAEHQALQDALARLRADRDRLEAIDRDAARFAIDAADLARRVGADCDDQPAARRARGLADRLQEARDVERKKRDLSRERDGEARQLAAAESEHLRAMARLDSLCKEAGCASHDELPAAERRSRDRGGLEDGLRRCEESLFAAGSGANLAEFAAMVEGRPVEELRASIARLDEEIGRLDREYVAEREAIAIAENELKRMDGGDESAELIEKSHSVLAKLHDDVTRYATLKLAAEVLQRGIDRYREKTQGSVVARAGHLFSELTGHSFAKLAIDDDEGRAVIRGVRPNGNNLDVKAMSDGSHDQLYLALRLASLESWLQSHEAIPLIVDDILLNFDDRRALGALRALAELSRKTQVLFFTHHRHLAELAMENLPADVAFLHELGGAGLNGRLPGF